MSRSRSILVAMLAAIVCAPTATGGAPPKPDAKIAAEVPAAIRATGTLRIATAATYPPNEFVRPNSRAIVGMDADLVRALAGVMGLRVRIVDTLFDNIIPDVASGKYSLGISSITDTKAREKTVDFVTYYSAGTAFYVKANAGPTIRSLADLCGRTVAVVRGTTQASDAKAQNTACRQAKKPDVKIAVFPDDNGAYIALESSATAVGMADSPVAEYLVKESHGQLWLTGKPYRTAPYGIVVAKGSRMAKAVLAALKTLMADGTYGAILTRWGIQRGAIANPQINAAAG